MFCALILELGLHKRLELGLLELAEMEINLLRSESRNSNNKIPAFPNPAIQYFLCTYLKTADFSVHES